LDNGLKIKLIGVKPKPEKNAEAIKFLKEKLKGQKVFIKFDDVKYDDKTTCFATSICGIKHS
jgi:modification methylase